ncbi:VTC domain-containing protein [Mucor mucedo]|uniref:VTC domain-containing protein n=1 Tax=Mucor mucedo TaxID=29922 RepID=UPI00221EDF17|nr:VTC domain-containing protein [Mucor mucedo]KAI7873277.1 VTC domain-containing protein [Mucor mucedo]
MDRLRWIPLPRTQSTLSDFMRQTDNASFDRDWKQLRFAPWRFFYLDYHHHLQQEGQTMEQWLVSEWIKVYEFYMLKKGEIERRVSGGDPKEIPTLQSDIQQLYHFSKLNYCGFLRLFMQYHRLFGSGPPPTDALRRLMMDRPFWDTSSHFFSMLVPFNRLCIHSTALPSCDSSKRSLDTIVTATHESSVKKYWLHSDHVIELYLLLSTHGLQIQDNNAINTATDEIGHPQGFKSTNDIHPSSIVPHSGRLKISTTYLDSPDLNDYTDRLVGQSDTLSCTKSIRTRTYDNVPYASLEQKMYYHQQHHRKKKGKEPECCGTLTTLAWIQQRVWLKQKHLASLFRAEYSLSNLLDKPSCLYRTDGLLVTEKDVCRMKQTSLHMQEQVHHKIKIPVLKTSQYRTVFANKDITVTIDTDISFTRPHQPESNRFPYCVVQIQHSQTPTWLSELEASRLLEPVHDFSLYLHGISILHRVHVYPPWQSKFTSSDIRYPRHRGSLLSLNKTKDQVTNATTPPVSWSSDTIVTLDEDTLSSSSSTCSSLLSPTVNKQGQLRRSFDSYCSFDHPTSSKSDPTNCKSCQTKLNPHPPFYGTSHPKKPTNRTSARGDITFFSVLKNACLSTFHKKGEKTSLLPQYHTHTGISRPTIITLTCVFTSFVISYLLYLFILKIK